MLSITDDVYDTIEGRSIHLFTLRNAYLTVTLTNLGASIRTLYTSDRDGRQGNVVAGYEDVLGYRHNPTYLGCVVGRYVNRIGRGRFVLDGVSYQLTLNEGTNHLHGGFQGFHKQVWDVQEIVQEEEVAGVVMEYYSRDGEEGYPGNLDTAVRYMLRNDNRLYISYSARTDKKTPVNLSNHSYFNLSGFADPLVKDHVLQVHAGYYAEKNGNNLPTGTVLAVEGTPLDFSTPRRIGENIHRFPSDLGFDHNYVLDKEGARPLPAAILRDPASGRRLKVYTDQPCLQVYTANWWDGSVRGAQGMSYRQHGAVALETQSYPDSPNHPVFPSTILEPGDVYQSTTIFEFDTQ